jgi:hypothetical protein
MDCTQQSGTSSDPFKYYLRAQRPSGQTHTNVNIGVALELADVIALRGKTLTFSCKMRKGANYSATSDAIQMSCGSNNDAADQDKSQNHVDGIASVTKTLTSSWQTFSVSHTVESDAVALVVRLKASTSGTAGAADYFDLAQAKLELGSQTEFEPRSYGQELALCQRYYEKSYNDGVAPATSTYEGVYTNGGMVNMPSANYTTRAGAVYKVPKRAVPTVVTYDTAGNTGKCNYPDATTNASFTVVHSGANSFTAETSNLVNATDTRCYFHFTADSEL